MQVRVKGEQHGTVCAFQVGFYFTLLRAANFSNHVEHTAVCADRSGPTSEELQEERATRVHSSMYCLWAVVVSILFYTYLYALVWQKLHDLVLMTLDRLTN